MAKDSSLKDAPTFERPQAVDAPSWRRVLRLLVINALCPFLTYQLLTSYAGVSQITALAVGAMFPATNGIVSVVQRRSLDFIGAIVLSGIIVGIIATAVGNSTLLLIRDAVIAGILGITCMLSLSWTRPLMFYVSRQFSTGDDPDKVQAFNALWQLPRARLTFRMLTAVWAAGWIGQFALAVLIVETLSIAHVLVVLPIVSNGLTVGLFAWTFAYVRHQRQHGQAAGGSVSPTSA
jgi:hypothetical protein